MAKLIDGKALAAKISSQLKTPVSRLKERNINPHLVSVLVGQNHGAGIYAKQQRRAAESLKIGYDMITLSQDASQKDLIHTISDLNLDKSITGIILMMPLGNHIDPHSVTMAIDPSKDVEGIHPDNLGKLVYGRDDLLPCTAAAVMECIRATGVNLRGAEVCMIGHSNIVGKPAGLLCLDRLATVCTCHIGTRDLKKHSTNADIVIVAAGKPGLLTADMIRDDAIVIDVGINRVNGKITGDADFDAVEKKASWITPVPGGVGSLTTAMLMKNTITAAEIQNR